MWSYNKWLDYGLVTIFFNLFYLHQKLPRTCFTLLVFRVPKLLLKATIKYYSLVFYFNVLLLLLSLFFFFQCGLLKFTNMFQTMSYVEKSQITANTLAFSQSVLLSYFAWFCHVLQQISWRVYILKIFWFHIPICLEACVFLNR